MSDIVPSAGALAQLEDSHNLIFPMAETRQLDQFHKATLSQVVINPDPRGGDVWAGSHCANYNKDKGTASEYSLTKQGLQRLASAAGISWDHYNSGIKAAGDMVVYEAIGWIVGQAGQKIIVKGTKEVNKRDRFPVPMAETKAMNRAIRQLLNIKGKYSPKELSRPFLIPRIDFSPDFSDPEVRALTQQNGIAGIRALFGGGQEPEPTALLAAPEEFDPQTGEIEEPPAPKPSGKSPEWLRCQRLIFGIASDVEEVSSEQELYDAVKSRMRTWAQDHGKNICGWRGDEPSIGASNESQMKAMAKLYEALKIAQEVPL